MPIKRREFMQYLGANMLLPYMVPGAQWFMSEAHAASIRKNFLAVYFPNGAYMPNATDGDWHWNSADGALNALNTTGLKSNVMLLRKMQNGFGDRDPHWQNVAGFLSGKKIVLDKYNHQAGETIDQIIARKKNTYLNSVQAGANYYHIHEQADHPNYSSIYTNRISYNSQGQAINPISDPQYLFDRLFSAGGSNMAVTNYLKEKKKSILDVSLYDLNAVRKQLPATGKSQLDAFETSLRDVETQLDKARPVCSNSSSINASGNYSDINATFIQRSELINRIMVLALQCGITNVGSIMYSPSISSHLNYSGALGTGLEHHTCAHNGGDANRIARMKQITRMYVNLFTHLVQNLKSAGLLSDTLVLMGSDMSDGDLHLTTNIPMLLAGEGSDLKFGQEIIPTANTQQTSLLLRILELTGVNDVSSLGEGSTLSASPLTLINK